MAMPRRRREKGEAALPGEMTQMSEIQLQAASYPAWPQEYMADGRLYVPLTASADGPCYVCDGLIAAGEDYWFGSTWMCDRCRVTEKDSAA